MKTLIHTTLIVLALVFGNTAQAQTNDDKILDFISSFEKDKCAVLEVTHEMFELLSQNDRASAEIRSTLSQINHLVYLNCFGMVKGQETTDFDLTKAFKEKANGYGFKLLLRAENGLSNQLFYKKENAEYNEYILITNVTIQYLSTELNVSSIRELKDIMALTDEAGGL